MTRVAVPKLEVPEQIVATGISLINCLADDMFEYINAYLETLGTRSLYLTSDGLFTGDPSLNMRDPSSLFKVLSRSDYPVLRDQFRSGLNLKVENRHRFEFYNKISEILDDRHDWIHKNISPSELALRELINNVLSISETLDLLITQDCKVLLEAFNADDAVSGTDSSISETTQLVQEIQKVLVFEEPAIGTEVSNEFLTHSYTLHISGQIRDRKTDKLLEEEIGNLADPISALLIARKPTGGRLKITSSGDICAYFDGTWGYLAHIESANWFPGHL